jgi:hypothetical protein
MRFGKWLVDMKKELFIHLSRITQMWFCQINYIDNHGEIHDLKYLEKDGKESINIIKPCKFRSRRDLLRKIRKYYPKDIKIRYNMYAKDNMNFIGV